MKLNRTTALKSLLVITAMLLLALILKPVAALAEDYKVTFVIADDRGYLTGRYSDKNLGTTVVVDAPDGKVLSAPQVVHKTGYESLEPWAYSNVLDGYDAYIESVSADLTCGNSSIPIYVSAGMLSTKDRNRVSSAFQSYWFSVTQDTTITIRLYPRARIVFQADETVTQLLSNKLTTFDLFAGEESIDSHGGDGVSVNCIDGYEFDYWTADADVSTDTATFKEGDHIPYRDAEKIIPTQGFHLTAHTKKVTRTATFTTDGPGTVTTSPEDVHLATRYRASADPATQGILVGQVTTCTNPTASTGYEFDYWTSNVYVYSLSSGLLTAIHDGTPLTTEEVNSCYIDQNTTFTAHFKQTGPIPEPDPVNPDDGGDTDGSDTIKPADDTTSKLTPKTGDSLPGATVAVALGAGVVVAGAALLKKRCR